MKLRKVEDNEGKTYKVFFKLKEDNAGFGGISPLKLSKALKKAVRGVIYASMLNNNSLMIIFQTPE